MTRLSLKPTHFTSTSPCDPGLSSVNFLGNKVTLKIKTWQALTSSHFGTLEEKTMLEIEAPSETLEFV